MNRPLVFSEATATSGLKIYQTNGYSHDACDPWETNMQHDSRDLIAGSHMWCPNIFGMPACHWQRHGRRGPLAVSHQFFQPQHRRRLVSPPHWETRRRLLHHCGPVRRFSPSLAPTTAPGCAHPCCASHCHALFGILEFVCWSSWMSQSPAGFPFATGCGRYLAGQGQNREQGPDAESLKDTGVTIVIVSVGDIMKYAALMFITSAVDLYFPQLANANLPFLLDETLHSMCPRFPRPTTSCWKWCPPPTISLAFDESTTVTPVAFTKQVQGVVGFLSACNMLSYGSMYAAVAYAETPHTIFTPTFDADYAITAMSKVRLAKGAGVFGEGIS